VSTRNSLRVLVTFVGLLLAAISPLTGQTSNLGSVNITVVDPSGAAIPNVQLELTDLATNDVRRAETQPNGIYTFPNLPIGTYKLTLAANGFQNQVFETVVVQAARQTSLNATMQIGGTTQTVVVQSDAAPVVDTTSSVLSTTIDTKQVVNLPILNRSVMGLAFLVPGWASTGANSSNGTWNNMPGGAVVSADFDGTPGISNRFRSGGFNYGTTSVQPRMENVEEMTIQTAQIDLGGTGTSAMRISIVTRRGTNAFHGRLFEDFRNSVLQANSWINNARGLPRGQFNLNDFGGNIGGPILKNKLFFFFTWAQSIQPQTNTATTPILSQDAQRGLYTYRDTAGNMRTVNLLQIGAQGGGRGTVHPNIADQFSKMNQSVANGVLIPTTDPNLSNLSFQWNSRVKNYYPATRVDWNAKDYLRFRWSYAQQKNNWENRYNEQFPGVDPINKTSSGGNNRIAGFGFDWTISPTLINQFQSGYMYQYSVFSPENLGLPLETMFRQNWGYGTSLYGGAYPRRAISSFYPLLSANNSLTWQKGSHSYIFGASWWREQDHYWNGAGGEPSINFGITAQDPLSAVFNTALTQQLASNQNLNQAQALYALLTGRISGANIAVGRPLDPATKTYKPFGAYNLNEISQAAGFWVQDSWRIRSNFTLNYGLRMDYVRDTYNKDGGYSTLPTLGDLWGPTPVGAAFQPGVLGGVNNPTFRAQVHTYKPVFNYSPAMAIAWSPQMENGFLGKLVGKGKTVIRTGYSLRHYTEGAQNFWAYASNSGQFFFQQGVLQSNPTPTLGNFTPGSLHFGDPLPPYLLTPREYATQVPASQLFAAATFWGMNPDIVQPYVQQWNFGIQRSVGPTSAVEVRYVGNLSLKQWLGYNINDINIFENGFIDEFRRAQGNLAVNRANGRGNTFINNGLPGQAALPIFQSAFGGVNSNFANGAYINNLDNGAAGTLANAVANNPTFLCNMVGTAAFPACAARGVNVAGAGYPVNFFQVNPFATGRAVNYLDAAGMSNYHALQLEFRQRPTWGAQFNVNYTWAKSMGISAQNGIQGQGNNIYFTARNFRLNYQPGIFDIRHVFRVSGTYDLPFGQGKPFLSGNKALNYLVGGWTLGTITVIQSGTPAVMSGGFGTINTTDAGVAFADGTTLRDFQSAIGVYKGGNPWVTTVDPKFIAATGQANSTLVRPHNTAGVWGYRPVVYGPGWWNIDMSVNKAIPIREGLRASLQALFLNALNHPTFGLGGMNVQSLTFGQATGGPSNARIIQLRANIEF